MHASVRDDDGGTAIGQERRAILDDEVKMVKTRVSFAENIMSLYDPVVYRQSLHSNYAHFWNTSARNQPAHAAAVALGPVDVVGSKEKVTVDSAEMTDETSNDGENVGPGSTSTEGPSAGSVVRPLIGATRAESVIS